MNHVQEIRVTFAGRGLRMERIQVLRHAAQFQPLLKGCVSAAQFGRFRFERLAHNIPTSNLLRSGDSHTGANPRSALHKSLALQALKSF
jgi:hypothetical protein